MSDLFAEVDELMHQERLAKIWKDYGSLILAFIVGCILFAAALSGFKTWNNTVRETQTTQIIALQASPDYPHNILEADLSDMRSGLRGMAYLSAADSLLGLDKKEDALTLYKRTADDTAIPNEFTHLADLMIARLSIDNADMQATPLLKRMEHVYSFPDSPWIPHARLESALIEAHLNQNYEAAQIHLNIILDTPGLPKTLYEKAQALSHVYRLKSQDKAPKATGAKS